MANAKAKEKTKNADSELFSFFCFLFFVFLFFGNVSLREDISVKIIIGSLELDLYPCNNIHSQSRTQPAAKGYRVHSPSWLPPVLWANENSPCNVQQNSWHNYIVSCTLPTDTLVNTSTWGQNYNLHYWYIFYTLYCKEKNLQSIHFLSFTKLLNTKYFDFLPSYIFRNFFM